MTFFKPHSNLEGKYHFIWIFTNEGTGSERLSNFLKGAELDLNLDGQTPEALLNLSTGAPLFWLTLGTGRARFPGSSGGASLQSEGGLLRKDQGRVRCVKC